MKKVQLLFDGGFKKIAAKIYQKVITQEAAFWFKDAEKLS